MNLLWFRNDLRTRHHLALSHALAAQDECVAVYIDCPTQWQQQSIGAGPNLFKLLHVKQLFKSLNEAGIASIFVSLDDFSQVPSWFRHLKEQLDYSNLIFHREYGVWEQSRDDAVREALSSQGISVKSFDDHYILPPATITKDDGDPYKVFTPFSKTWRQTATVDYISHNLGDDNPLKSIQNGAQSKHTPYGLDYPSTVPQTLINSLKSKTQAINAISLTQDNAQQWGVGEDYAHTQLQDFIAKPIGLYKQARDIPHKPATSGLSPYLAMGVISSKFMYLQAQAHLSQFSGDGAKGVQTWINELIWRDFYSHIMVHFPHVSKDQNFNQKLNNIPWKTNPQHFEAWREGLTGVPLVDAGMRQLVTTGWMHNRIRMVTAMFLTKNLFMDWRQGEAFFMQHLLDGDFFSNNGGWQWSASTGTDAAPYFRVFNPLTQAERFDPECDYIRHFVPELKNASTKAILKADKYQAELQEHGYVPLIVDVKASRAEAIEIFKGL